MCRPPRFIAMKTMTNEQINKAMESGSRGASEYFDACCKWIKANHSSLSKLHKAFESDTASKMDFSVFCSGMFNETEAGQAAASVLAIL